jgi:hypothetical protein
MTTTTFTGMPPSGERIIGLARGEKRRERETLVGHPLPER